jgi:cardiolipin synthase
MEPWWWQAVVLVGEALGLGMVPVVIQRRKPAVSAIAWILALVLLPWLGVLAYLVMGDNRMERRLRKRRRAAQKLEGGLGDLHRVMRGLRLQGTEGLATLHDLPRALALVAMRLRARPPSVGNRVELLEDGAQKFPRLLEEIARAQDHVHLVYYIFEADGTGAMVRDALIERARAGVEVRVLWDAIGSASVAGGFFHGLEEAGGKVATFLPIRLFNRRLDLNFRNHRKIVVVDGRVGFVGGMNIGDEYSGRQGEGWHDLHLRIEGPAVHDLQEAFAEDWYFAAQENLARARYFILPRRAGDEPVQIVVSGPDQAGPAIHQLFFTALAQARERVFMMTPYFVPTEALVTALVTAAQRGVEVRILLPARSDQPLAYWAGRSYYQELLQAGVRIYEHTRSVLHGKAMSVDGVFATVGTSNFDERSFYLNFEVNALVYSATLAAKLEALIRRDTQAALEISLGAFQNRPKGLQLLENACRLLSPML